MPNMNQALARHNSEVSKHQIQTTPPDCNCRGGPAVCPVRGACQTVSVVYQATVVREDTNASETYTGLTSRRFKDRFYEHTIDMKHQNKDGTGLSNYIWKLKNSSTPFKISWQIISKAPIFNPTTKSCKLCLKEKFLIVFRPEGATLNDRNEIFAACRHILKSLLSNS